jgi:predicted DNA-binding protein (MmcQ/YjbR family)
MDHAEELRAEYDAIQPGFHMSKTHWNTIAINESSLDALSKSWINHSMVWFSKV